MQTASSFTALWHLLSHARAHRGRIIAASLCSVANKLFDVAPEILIGIAIDVVTRGKGSFLAGFGVVEPLNQVYVLGALTLIIWVCESIFEYAYALLWRGIAQTLQHDLRLAAYAHVQRLDLAYFEDRSSGGLTAILNDDVNQLERFFNTGANDLIQVLVTVIAVGGVFFAISPQLAWLAFTPIPVILWGAFYFQHKAGPRYDIVREKVSILSARLNNNIAGITTIRSFSAEQRETDRLAADSTAYVDANRAAIRLSSAFVPLIRMAVLFGFLCTLVRGGELVLAGGLQPGFYAVLVFLTQRLLWPLTRLADTVDLFERAMASTRRILGLIETPIAIRDENTVTAKCSPIPFMGQTGGSCDTFARAPKPGMAAGPLSEAGTELRAVGAHSATSEGSSCSDLPSSAPWAPSPVNGRREQPPAQGAFSLQKVSFRYASGADVLNDIELDIPSGHTIALVGATGGGKTSLIKLLLRFYDPTAGAILLDGRPLASYSLAWLRAQIGWVSQDVFLFDGSVRDNIAYGRPDASFEDIVATAKAAEAHDFVMRLPHAYDTPVGERGIKLSGGQRQRLSIARALLKNPPILLLDEATSSVDNETEAAIQRSLRRLAHRRTVIVIAHRLSTIVHADQIVVIEQGRIVERGTHAELLARDGSYASLWKVQTGEVVE